MNNKWKKLAQEVGKELDNQFSDRFHEITHLSGKLRVLIEKSGIDHDRLNDLIDIIQDVVL